MKYLRVLIITIIVVLLIRTFAFTSCTIPFSGMENSLYQGERVIVNKWSYGFRMPFMGLFSYHRLLGSPVKKNDIVLFNNPQIVSGKPIAVDNRELFMSRCVGLPGDTLMLDKYLSITAQEILSPDYKSLYLYPQENEDIVQQAIKRLNIENNELIGYNDDGFIRSFSHYEIYLLKQSLGGTLKLKSLQADNNEDVHPFVIPAKGNSVRVYPWNVNLLRNTIVCHEGRQADVKGDTLLLDGKKIFSYVFTKDYYWMASNNSVNLNDSRLFGLVPDDHIVGKASLIWFSKDREAGFLDGFRWNRFFHTVK